MNLNYSGDVWWPVAWSKAHPRDAIPFHAWIAWHYVNLIPRGTA